MKVAILDDWYDTLRGLRRFEKLAALDVTVWNDHVEERRRPCRAAQGHRGPRPVRERTAIRAPLIERLPQLRLISQRSVYPHIDIAACTRHGIVVSSGHIPARRPTRLPS